MRGRDRAATAVLLVFGLLALEEARKLRFGAIAKPGPGFFPVVLAAAFSLVCVALLVAAWRAREEDSGLARETCRHRGVIPLVETDYDFLGCRQGHLLRISRCF